MAKQTTRWRPDTCECVIHMEWDDTVAENSRTFAGKTVEMKCAAHQGISDASLLDELFGENQHKNRVVSKAMEVMGIDPRQALEENAVEFSFDTSRKLEVRVKGMDAQKKAELDAALEADPLIDTRKDGRLKSVISK